MSNTGLHAISRVAPLVTLFCLAPFFGELLLGNLTLAELPLFPVLAPLYGFGAIVVRELGRRFGGWPSIFLLAIAYALIEEGPVDQLLFSNDYAGVDYVGGTGEVSGWGINVVVVQIVIAMHALWSISVPIALTEALFPRLAEEPWLPPRALALTIGLYAASAALTFLGNWREERFVGSAAQNLAFALAIAVLIVAAIRLRLPCDQVPGDAPSPTTLGVIALVATSLYWGSANLLTGALAAWLGSALWWLLLLGASVLIWHWSRRHDWGPAHRFALAAGATLTYAWVAFAVDPETANSRGITLSSHLLFGAIAVGVLLLAGRRVGAEGG